MGSSIALEGDRVVVGSRTSGGRAYVFDRGPAGWTLTESLTSPGQDTFNRFGAAVAIDGDVLAIGAPLDTLIGVDAGVTYVYRDVGGSLSLEVQLAASDGQTGDDFGTSLALDGQRLVIGAPRDQTLNGIASGSAYVFEKQARGWTQTKKLVPSDASPLASFGTSIALEDDLLIVGAPENHHSGFFDAGSVYVFEFDGTRWNEELEIVAPVPANDDSFGTAIGLDGDCLAVTARKTSIDGSQGGAHLFRRQAGSWNLEQTLSIVSAEERSISIDGDLAVLASTQAAQVFRFTDATWVPEQVLMSSGFDDYGWALDLEGERLAVGAPSNDIVGNNAGAAYIEDLALSATVYCTAKTTSNGCVPVIDSAGVPSASGATAFPITAREIPNQKPGLLFYGRGGPAALPFLGGTLCVLPPLVRTPVQSSGGNPPPADCSGSYLLDFSQLAPSDPNLGPGDGVHAQYWFRDPTHPDGSGAGLSDALAFELCE